MTIAIIVHGGASTVEPGQEEAYRRGVLAALDAGWAVLERGGDACAATEAAIRSMEADETFNAGRGSALNAEGEVEMDAALMEGKDLRYGALTGGRTLRHPISVAHKILAEGPLLLAGEGLHRFAASRGAELCDPLELVTEKQRTHWEEMDQQLQQQRETASKTKDTVGCVALPSAVAVPCWRGVR
jgi:L-asparaginase / beta-aspartyl-peptidase